MIKRSSIAASSKDISQKKAVKLDLKKVKHTYNINLHYSTSTSVDTWKKIILNKTFLIVLELTSF